MTQSHESYEWQLLQERIAKNSQKPDPVNSPSHYKQGGIECIDAIKASMSHLEFKGYLKGNLMKYVWRYKNKGNEKQDLDKACWYLNRLSKEIS